MRDESDVIAAIIEHHLAAGVDFIIATDNGSVDGTVDILSAYRDLGVLELNHESRQDFEQGRWVTWMARRCAQVYDADWVINADADEFFWPTGIIEPDTGSLRAVLSQIGDGHDRVMVPGSSLLAHPEARGSWVDRVIVKELRSELSTKPSVKILPKCCHRADSDVTVGEGNHAAEGPLIEVTSAQQPLELLHVPNRGYEQYWRKVKNKGESFAKNKRLPKETGLLRRQEYDRLLAGELVDSYLSQQLTVDQFRQQIEFNLAIDTRLRDRLYKLLPDALIPSALRESVSSNWTEPAEL